MKYFLDTEFYEDGKTIDLISIGIVCEDGREYYAASLDAALGLVSPWVRENVLPHLPPTGAPTWKSRTIIAKEIELFVLYGTGKPEFWGYFSDYDWVVLCQLFGTMMNLPKGFPMFCMDLKQRSVERGSPKHPKQESGEHNALFDARWNRDLYAFLEGYQDELRQKFADIVTESRAETVSLTTRIRALENSLRLARCNPVMTNCDADNPCAVHAPLYRT